MSILCQVLARVPKRQAKTVREALAEYLEQSEPRERLLAALRAAAEEVAQAIRRAPASVRLPHLAAIAAAGKHLVRLRPAPEPDDIYFSAEEAP